MQIQAAKDTGSSSSKQKERRKKLSDRFDNMEKIMKKKKEEEEIAEEKEKEKDIEVVATKPKTQRTTFTVQMSSKKAPSSTTAKPKVTLVPGRFKWNGDIFRPLIFKQA